MNNVARPKAIEWHKSRDGREWHKKHYEEYLKDSKQKVKKTCIFCGNEFIALPAKVNNGHITSCGCAIQSSGERYISSVLTELDAKFIDQYVFSDCKYKQLLKFDFAIFNDNKLLYLIEYDGKQHFEPIDWFGGIKGFEETQIRDNIKNEYCQKHNIPLLRFPYTLSNEKI